MQKIAIAGYGTVGGGVAEILRRNAAKIAESAGEPVELKYILVRRDFPGDPFEKEMVRDFSMIESDPEVTILVETIGGCGAALEYCTRALKAGKSVVTANKQLIAEHGAELLALAKANGVSLLFEASVGGGIPVLHPLSQCLGANEIYEVRGILNGIDYDVWNPHRDPLLPAHYDISRREGKKTCRRALMEGFGWDDDGRPLIIFVGRLTEQKGVDIMLEALERFMPDKIYALIIGSGNEFYNRKLADFEASHSASVRTVTAAAFSSGKSASPGRVAQTRVSPRQSAAGRCCASTRAARAASPMETPRRCRSMISVCSRVQVCAWAAASEAAARLRCTAKSLYSSTHPPMPKDAASTSTSRQTIFCA